MSLPARFAAAMAGLGPFEPSPLLGIAVSGGADSLALALLADGWARGQGGQVRALIVDHGLRAASGQEAAITAARLAGRGIAAEIFPLHDLQPGPGLAARARDARYAALAAACRRDGILHLLLGHHAADQAETVLIRALAGSGAPGMAAMAGLRETAFLRLLRPLLSEPPGVLRDFLREAGLEWVEDPSNASELARRGRLRALRADPPDIGTGGIGAGGAGPASRALAAAAAAAGALRGREEAGLAALLARRVHLYPEGFARLSPGALPAAALAALLGAVGGGEFAPRSAALARLAADPGPATLDGVRLLAGGRLGAGLLLVREAAAVGPPVPALPGICWDRRFRLPAGGSPASWPPGSVWLGALGGAAAARLRRDPALAAARRLPAAVLAVLPAYRDGAGRLCAVPHLGWPAADAADRKPAADAADRKPAADAADRKPAADAADRKPAADAAEYTPLAGAVDTKPALPAWPVPLFAPARALAGAGFQPAIPPASPF